MKESMMPGPEDLKRIQEENMSEKQVELSEAYSAGHDIGLKKGEKPLSDLKDVNEWKIVRNQEEIREIESVIKNCGEKIESYQKTVDSWRGKPGYEDDTQTLVDDIRDTKDWLETNEDRLEYLKKEEEMLAEMKEELNTKHATVPRKE